MITQGLKRGLMLAGAAFAVLAAGCCTGGCGTDYGTNAVCCSKPATCCPAPSCKGCCSCKSACDTCNTCNTCDTCCPNDRVVRRHRHRD